jgi:hypothetical protein
MWYARGVLATLGVSTLAIAAADVLNPQYDPLSETVSRYVNGTAGWLTTVAILGIGAASAAPVPLLRGAGRWVLAVWAAGVLVAGVFPADLPGRWSQPSVSEMVHGLAAWVAFTAFPVAALLLARALPERRTALLVCAVGSIVATAAQRVLIAVNMAWVAFAAGAATGGRSSTTSSARSRRRAGCRPSRTPARGFVRAASRISKQFDIQIA